MSALSRIRARLGLLTGALVVLMPLSQLGFIPVSAVIGAELGVGAASIGLAIGLYAVAAAVATIVLGPLFDLVPVRSILPWAVALNLAVSVAFVWSPNFELLVAGRVLAGFANSALALSASVIVADAFRDAPAERDRAYSGMQTFVSTGAISGLALGGLCAGLGMPWLYFVLVAGYAVVILCLTPLILARTHRFPAHAPSDSETTVDSGGVVVPAKVARASPLEVLRGIARIIRTPQTILLLGAATCCSWVLQSGHYLVSMLLNSEDPVVVVRAILTVMIPVGVLLGAVANQWSLGRWRPRGVYGRAYTLLPIAGGALALVLLLSDVAVVWAVALLAVGIVCGMLGPLQPTIMIGWYPELRGSAAAAISVSASLGAAMGPVIAGAVASAWAIAGAAVVVVGVALVGCVLALLLARADPGLRLVPVLRG